MILSWRVAIFVLLAVVLIGGLGWYERSRPSSRVVALVAALAALAVAGRLAFAAIPNVQATTDVVLLSGYAIGAGPGFAIGALGALISNFWLGQGPWTPWEMVGWGLVGVGGAGLAAISRRHLGRLSLAVACGLAGLAYGALLDYSVMATSGGDQTLDRFLAISARGVPFNVAHAAGNFVLALVAGPALVRIIARYRQRLDFTWRREWAAPLLAAIVVAGVVTGPAPRAGARGASPAAWLAKAENANGGFGVAPGSSSSPEMTGWAMLGLEAAGRNPLDLDGKRSPPAYLRAHAGALGSTGDLERTILALRGAGIDPRGIGGHDLPFELRGRRRGDGSYGGEVNLTAFGILALRSAGEPAASLRRSRRWLEHAHRHNGGWGFQRGVASDPDSTGAALQGLVAAGGSRRAVRHGVAYLNRDQNHDGGWPLGGTGPSNSQSTAWAIQGLIAAGTNPAATRAGGHSGLDYLAARQAGDGHYRYSASSDQTPVWVTGEVLMAVERKALPLASVPRAPRHHGGKSGGGSGGSGGVGAGGGSGSSGSGSGASGGGQAPAGSGGATSSHGGGGQGKQARGARYHGLGGKPASGGARNPGAAPKSTPRGLPPAPAGAKSASAPSPARSDSSSGGGGPPFYAYVAVGACLVVLLGGGGIWWYRSGGWVPQLPRLRSR